LCRALLGESTPRFLKSIFLTHPSPNFSRTLGIASVIAEKLARS
jgi:hypothetical protein